MVRAPLVLLAGLAVASTARAEIPLGEYGGVQVGLEGLLQWDLNDFHNDRADLNGPGGDDLEQDIRRSEIILKGRGKEGKVDWTLAYDVKAERALDVNLRWKTAFGSLTVGQFKQYNGLEELSASRSNDFVSKSTASNLFAIGRRLGVGWSREAAAGGMQLSGFTRELSDGFNRGRGWAARGWWSPVNEGGEVWHFGGSWVAADTPGDRSRVRVRPNADFASVRLLDSGAFANTDTQDTLGLEAMWIKGPWRVQAELFQSSIDRYAVLGAPVLADSFKAQAWSVQSVWNVGGQGFGYKGGVPGTTVPATAGDRLWQLTMRWDGADLDDGAVRGGRGQALTLGANAWIGPHFKLMGNVVKVWTERRVGGITVEDNPLIAELRLQLHW